MSDYLWVGIGGFIGSAARYAVAVAMVPSIAGRFPWATFAVNCVGCLTIGMLTNVLARVQAPDAARLFLMTGVLGGFTTFSAFGMEFVALVRRGSIELASLYILGSLLAGVGAVWLGLWLTSVADA